MRLTDFVVREALVPRITANTKEEVIREMVRSLCSTGRVPAKDENGIVEAILKRESLATTGIGRGVAIPHARYENLSQLIAAIGLAPQGIPFDSNDNEPVHVVWMLLYSPDKPGEHLRALERVSTLLRQDKFRTELMNCTSADEMWQKLATEDAVKA